ncbi:hypothetical protein GCM10011375_39460 [Hymenobacter qilianensis]|uniref:Uncharacterized protein n=1 Tax=Hymenobacter qilianensis TaxID=1385715 RepID=A0ACB5PX21_9BACT|nr:hypothetical protein [Hymenobacter qilianensis]GGF80460.1 hypothetical protein GCM10011375_39460 [Hymenobacter qilianensis]
MLSTFDPFVFAAITAGSFVLSYLGCAILQQVFGYQIGRRKDKE